MVYVRSIFVLLAMCLYCKVGNAELAVMRSTYNGYNAALALDGDLNTCARTGYDPGTWWRVDLGTSQLVVSVDIIGGAGHFEVRVGEDDDKLGHREGFHKNSLCANVPTGMKTWGDNFLEHSHTHVHCKIPRQGQYVSILAYNPFIVDQLELCEVIVNWA